MGGENIEGSYSPTKEEIENVIPKIHLRAKSHFLTR
jgi:hypothetical protein